MLDAGARAQGRSEVRLVLQLRRRAARPGPPERDRVPARAPRRDARDPARAPGADRARAGGLGAAAAVGRGPDGRRRRAGEGRRARVAMPVVTCAPRAAGRPGRRRARRCALAARCRSTSSSARGSAWARSSSGRGCASLRASSGAREAVDTALRAVARRDQSAAELGRRLERRGVSPALRDETVERLEEVGLVDDERFARRLASRSPSAATGTRRSGGDSSRRGVGRRDRCARGSARLDARARARPRDRRGPRARAPRTARCARAARLRRGGGRGGARTLIADDALRSGRLSELHPTFSLHMCFFRILRHRAFCNGRPRGSANLLERAS